MGIHEIITKFSSMDTPKNQDRTQDHRVRSIDSLLWGTNKDGFVISSRYGLRVPGDEAY